MTASRGRSSLFISINRNRTGMFQSIESRATSSAPSTSSEKRSRCGTPTSRSVGPSASQRTVYVSSRAPWNVFLCTGSIVLTAPTEPPKSPRNSSVPSLLSHPQIAPCTRIAFGRLTRSRSKLTALASMSTVVHPAAVSKKCEIEPSLTPSSAPTSKTQNAGPSIVRISRSSETLRTSAAWKPSNW
eukprot:Amastigsp_a676498_19.p2 type:complete len:186 gc:universal Amastigsp_a676498_19:126-683(+)